MYLWKNVQNEYEIKAVSKKKINFMVKIWNIRNWSLKVKLEI